MRAPGVRVSMFCLLVLLAACADAAPTPEPTLPPRPDVPDRWRTVTSDEGDLQLAVPRETNVTGTAGGIVGDLELGAATVQLTAVAPAQLEQRQPGQSRVAWIEAGLLPEVNEVGDRGPIGQRQMSLPAGPALELSATYAAGTASEAWIIVYVIATPRGDGILELGAPGPRPDADGEEIRLMRELVAFD